ncbi:MAG: cyclase family protein [Raineya sp.]
MRKIICQYSEVSYVFDLTAPLDISIPVQAGENNPNCYFAEPPKFETIIAGDFVGSVALGGTCNYQKITLTPHGNGTHTECYGHISDDKASICQLFVPSFAFAQLISITPRTKQSDKVIFWEDIESKIDFTKPLEALILRTLPNEEAKKTRNYNQTNPPYLHSKVGEELAIRDVKHLLVDLPSVDKEVDGGKLLTHKAFWQYPKNIRKDAFITELIFVDDTIADGFYLLNLQTISLDTDAAPSKPLLYKLED